MAKFLLSAFLGLRLMFLAMAQGSVSTLGSRTRSLYRVTPQTKEHMEFMTKFVAYPEVIIMSPLAQVGGPVDILIPRNMVATVRGWLQQEGIHSELIDKRVKISYSTPYVEKYRTLNGGGARRDLAGLESHTSPMLRDDLYCPGSNFDMSKCRKTGCLTAFEQASSICERWVGDKRYSVQSTTQSYCWFFTTDYTCCFCKNFE